MALLSVFGPLCENHFQYHDLEGNPRKIPKYKDDARCSLPGSSTKLRFILMYLTSATVARHYHGLLFGMQQPQVSKWVKLLLPLLEKALARLKALPKRFGYELYAFLQTFTRYVLLMDVTARRPGERCVPRSVDYERQKYEYSHRGPVVKRKPILSRTM